MKTRYVVKIADPTSAWKIDLETEKAVEAWATVERRLAGGWRVSVIRFSVNERAKGVSEFERAFGIDRHELELLAVAEELEQDGIRCRVSPHGALPSLCIELMSARRMRDLLALARRIRTEHLVDGGVK